MTVYCVFSVKRYELWDIFLSKEEADSKVADDRYSRGFDLSVEAWEVK